MFEDQSEAGLATVGKVPSLKDRLDMGVAKAEENLRKAKRAREILDKNPELEELINIMNSTPLFRY